MRLAGSSPPVLAEVHLTSGSPVPVAVGHPEIAVTSLRGDVKVDDEALASGQLAVLRPDTATTLDGVVR